MLSGSLPELALLLPGPESGMRSRRPKLLHPVLGRPLGAYAVEIATAAGLATVAVAAEYADRLGEGVRPVASPAAALDGISGTVLLLRADSPLLTPETLSAFLLRSEGAAGPSLLSADPDGVAPTALLIGASLLLQHLPTEELRDVETVLASLRSRGVSVRVEAVDDASVGLRVEDRVALAAAGLTLRQRILQHHMLNGVTIEDLLTTYVEPGVTIGPDTVIRPMTWLAGNTSIGEDCEIGPSVRITDCALGSGVSVQSAVLAQSEVGDECKIGPFAQLRPGCRLGRKVKVGNFVELKNAVVEDGVSIGHLAYVGDADVGEKTNIGAGTITCNYDGKRKHRTVIGKRTFIGSHTTLVAPVSVGEGAFTAAGTVVTQDVPADALAVGRARQANKEDWARRRRELQAEQ